MTTVPGHNIVIQQSVAAQELTHQAHNKSSPEQAAAQQQASELAKNTTVQKFDESERIKAKKEKDEVRRKQLLKEVKKKKIQEEMDQDPDAPGRLLDTTV